MIDNEKRKSSKKILTNEEIKSTLENAEDDLTLHEIGSLYGITRMRVCQINHIALKKLGLELQKKAEFQEPISIRKKQKTDNSEIKNENSPVK